MLEGYGPDDQIELDCDPIVTACSILVDLSRTRCVYMYIQPVCIYISEHSDLHKISKPHILKQNLQP